MKKYYLLLTISFLFYLIGHFLWTTSLIYDKPIILNDKLEIWFINIPFGLFALLGLYATYKLYDKS